MKTAISIPDRIFKAAERVAKKLSLSRSELYTRAIEQFVETHASADITERLDRVYDGSAPGLDSALKTMQQRALKGDSW